MKLTAQKEVLTDALQIVCVAVPKSSVMPIAFTTQINANADKNQARFTVNNLKSVASTVIEADISESGRVAVNARLLLSAIEALSGTISLDFNDKTLVVQGDSGKYDLKTLNVDDAPGINDTARPTKMEGDTVVTLKPEALSGMLDSARQMINPKDARLMICGAYIQVGDNLKITSSDGHRLCEETETEVEVEMGDQTALIVHFEQLGEILAFLKLLKADTVSMVLRQQNVVLRATGGFISACLVNGKFPDVEPVFPKDCANSLEVGTSGLLEGLSGVSVIGAEYVKLTLNNSGIAISGTADSGTGERMVPIKSKKLKETAFVFHYRGLVGLLNAIASDKFTMSYGHPEKPVLITTERQRFASVPTKKNNPPTKGTEE